MKIYYTSLLFLLLGLFSIDIKTMENIDPTKTVDKKLLNLKTIAAKNLKNHIKNNKITEEELAKLPSELRSFYNLFCKVETVLNNIDTKKIDESDEELTKQLSALICKFQNLLFYILESESDNYEICIDAINQCLDSYYPEITDQIKFINCMKMANLILEIFIDPLKINDLVSDYINDKNASSKKIKNSIRFFTIQALQKNLTHLIELLLKINIFSKKQIFGLLQDMCRNHCSPEMIELVTNEVFISKEIIEHIISKGILFLWINYDIDTIKLLFDKIEFFGLDVREIVNSNRYQTWKTLLNKEIYCNKLDVVEFLLSKGANPSISDPLSWSKKLYNEILRKEELQHEMPTCIKILNVVLQALLVNRNEANIRA